MHDRMPTDPHLVVAGPTALARALETCGHRHVSCVASSRDAIELCSHIRVDLVVVAGRLEDADGAALIAELSRTTRIPIVAVAAAGDRAARRPAVAAGA